MRSLIAVVVVLVGGCDVTVEFACGTASACGGNGQCVSGGCAFPDTSCPSGLRFDNSAAQGPICTVGEQPDMASADASTNDDLTPSPDLSHPLTWMSYPIESGKTVYSVWGSDPAHVWAVGTAGAVWSSTTMGASWASGTVALGDIPDLRGVWGSSRTDIFIVGKQGYVFHSADGGGSWQAQRKPPVGGALPNLVVVWGLGPSNVYAGQDENPPLHYNGNTWTQEMQPASVGCSLDICSAIWGSGPDDVYAVGDGAQHWDGMTWSTLTLPGPPGVLAGVWGSGKNDVFIVGDATGAGMDGVVLHSSDGGKTWMPSMFAGTPVTAIAGTSSSDVYVGTMGGKIFHSTDDGNSWKGPALTGAPMIWSMSAIDAANIYAAGDNQILFTR